MVRVTLHAEDLKRLADPHLIEHAEAGMIESAVHVLQPIARAEAPSRTGRGRGSILGVVERRGGKVSGRVHAGKAFYLRILASGTYKKPGGYSIEPRRFKSKTKARRAARALGPASATGALRALRFKVGGAYLFRARAMHPGLQPDDFFARAAARGESAVSAAADLVAQRAMDRATRG